jgi:hypothetical protein
MVQVVFDLVLLTRPWEYVPRLRPEIGLAVRTAAQFQGYKVIKFVIVDAAPSPVTRMRWCFIALVYSKGGLTVAV